MQIWLIANGGAICDRSIVEQLYDWCGLQQAMGYDVTVTTTHPSTYLIVTRSLQKKDKPTSVS
jgi:hypothetical protein